MVDTPEGTRKPNGITPPRGSDQRKPTASSPADRRDSSKYDIKKYDPRDYARGDEGRASPSPGSGRRPSAPGGGGAAAPVVKYSSAYGGGEQARHDSPTEEGKLDPRQKRPGDASSYYGGTPPAFPPPPGAEGGEGGGYSMSGALSSGGAYQSHAYGSTGAVMQTGTTNGAGQGSVASMAGPAAYFAAPPQQQMERERGLRAARVDTESALREYLDLQQRVRLGASAEDKERLKRCASRALGEVKELRRELNTLVKKKEGGRIGRFVVGGIVAGTIPIVKRFFRRPSDSPASKTEYAYKKSQSMVSRILSMLHKTGWAASIFMFVLAALYVFQAEVMIRVAKTMYKRLKRLVIKMEEGERLGRDGMVIMEESDLKVLKGWRWRVLLWSK